MFLDLVQLLAGGGAVLEGYSMQSRICAHDRKITDIVLVQNFLRTTEHVSDLLDRLWFMRPNFEKFADASRLLALPWYLIVHYHIVI